MNMVITGNTGIGKTTVCDRVVKLAANLGYACGGVLTRTAPDGGKIVVDIKSGEQKRLASISDVPGGPHIGKYFFDPAGIDFGVRAIERGVSGDILCVDEVGPLELGGGGFVNAVRLIREARVSHSILVVRKELLAPFISQLGRQLMVFETTGHNRDELPFKVCALLPGKLLASGLDSTRVERPMPVAKAMEDDTILAYMMNGDILPLTTVFRRKS